MREDLKQREVELEKSLEDKQQLKNQVQNLKEGLQKLQNSHVMQVSFTNEVFLFCFVFVLHDVEKMKEGAESAMPPQCERVNLWVTICLRGRLPNLHFNKKEMRSNV